MLTVRAITQRPGSWRRRCGPLKEGTNPELENLPLSPAAHAASSPAARNRPIRRRDETPARLRSAEGAGYRLDPDIVVLCGCRLISGPGGDGPDWSICARAYALPGSLPRHRFAGEDPVERGQAIDGDGWPAVVATWVPRLMPALRTALFHGAIRTAHAVRAVDAVDTPPRRGELARALGYWAARYREGQPASPLPHAGDLRMAVVEAAADGARRYLARPGIFHLHGVTARGRATAPADRCRRTRSVIREPPAGPPRGCCPR